MIVSEKKRGGRGRSPKKRGGRAGGAGPKFNPIGWCHFTLNFWWGCTEVSPACANCYAREFAKYVSRNLFGFLVEWGKGKARGERLEKARIEALALNRQAEKKGVRYRVFVNSMSDWLDEEVPTEWRAFLLETIWMCPQLDFQLLTKRPEKWHPHMCQVRLLVRRGEFHEWLVNWFTNPPSNVWIGTTVENQEWADKRVPELLKIPAAVRFLSCEPLLGPIDFAKVPDFNKCGSAGRGQLDGLWVIVGGESGGKSLRLMHPAWVRSLRDQCQRAGVAFYFKQWGDWAPQGEKYAVELPDTKKLKGRKHDDGTPGGWPLMLRVGTKDAGAFLDGKEHKEFPRLAVVP
jgi:protein gp37